MPTREFMRKCGNCGRPTKHYQQKPNHILHLILSIVTVGLWIPVWLLLGLFQQKPQCSECGHEPGLFGMG